MARRDRIEGKGHIVFGEARPVSDIGLVLDVEVGRVAVVAIAPLVPDLVFIVGALARGDPADVGVRDQRAVPGGARIRTWPVGTPSAW